MNKRKTVKIIAAAAAVIITVVTAAGYKTVLLRCAEPGTVAEGILPGSKTIENIPEGEIRYLINKTVYFESYRSTGKIMFENPIASEYSLKLSIYSDKGSLVYESPVLSPGQYIERDRLSKVLKPGIYNCAYSVSAYKNGEHSGQYTGTLKITVKK